MTYDIIQIQLVKRDLNVVQRQYEDYARTFEFETKIYNLSNIHNDKFFTVFNGDNDRILIYDNMTLELLCTLPFSNFKIDSMYWNQDQSFCIVTSTAGEYGILKRICENDIKMPDKQTDSTEHNSNKKQYEDSPVMKVAKN